MATVFDEHQQWPLLTVDDSFKTLFEEVGVIAGDRKKDCVNNFKSIIKDHNSLILIGSYGNLTLAPSSYCS